jgi:predicted TIM-barrel fold metal-dependent hydrolase
MTVVDVHTHLYSEPNLDVETTLSSRDVEAITREYVERIRGGPADHAVAIVMDPAFLDDEAATKDLLTVRDETDVFSTAFLVDPLADGAPEYVSKVADAGAVAIKIHPYIQELTPDTYLRVAETLRVAEREDLVTIVDCSYGGAEMTRANGVHLAHEIGQTLSSPVLLAHGGGPRILDAVASADSFSNLYLDTSFSLSYWEQSSVIDDYAFGYGKLGPDRWLWGSDDPYVAQGQAFERANEFLSEYDLGGRDRYFGGTAADVFSL